MNEDIASGRYVFLEEGSLMVEDIVVDDAGRFVCLASNSAGSERRIIELIVHGEETVVLKNLLNKVSKVSWCPVFKQIYALFCKQANEIHLKTSFFR